MTQTSTSLRDQLIRNFNSKATPEHFEKGGLYEADDIDLVNRDITKTLGATITTLPPGKRGCPYHLHHAQTEMFIVIEGSGTLRVAGEELPIGAGDVITIPPGPAYPHNIINSSNAPLRYISLSTTEQPELCEYPDSGKTMGWVRGGARVLNRPAQNLDYWDGEAVD